MNTTSMRKLTTSGEAAEIHELTPAALEHVYGGWLPIPSSLFFSYLVSESNNTNMSKQAD